MNKIALLVKGTGATVNIGLGFIPDRILVTNVSNAALPRLEWARGFSAGTIVPHGIYGYTAAANEIAYGQARAASDNSYGFVATAGISPYVGGSAADGTATFKVRADLVAATAGDMRVKTGTAVNAWTLNTIGSRTGKFNTAIDTTYVGAGSRICIDGRWYRITAISNDGDAADDITLDASAPSGAVDKITYLSDVATPLIGTPMPDGITLAGTDVNKTNEMLLVEAVQYDF